MDKQDMTDLICIRDSYKALNKSLHGEEKILEFNEGHLGALGRVCRVIERNVSESWQKDYDAAVRLLDVVSLTPEERAEILLGENRHRPNEEKEVLVGKYKFQQELKEAVLVGRINGEASIIIDGATKKARCHVMGKISPRGLPCLVSEYGDKENLRYTVRAISFDNKGEKRNWICVEHILLEKAMEYFLENHHMDNMLGGCEYVARMTTATAGKCRPDFQAGNAWVEMRILKRNADRSQGVDGYSIASSIRQVEKYCRQLSAMKETGKRMILLLVCQADGEEKQISFYGKTNAEIKQAVENGIEIWTAEMQIDTDGISLLSCNDITDKIMDN